VRPERVRGHIYQSPPPHLATASRYSSPETAKLLIALMSCRHSASIKYRARLPNAKLGGCGCGCGWGSCPALLTLCSPLAPPSHRGDSTMERVPVFQCFIAPKIVPGNGDSNVVSFRLHRLSIQYRRNTLRPSSRHKTTKIHYHESHSMWHTPKNAG
jgi:hypothetical protein